MGARDAAAGGVDGGLAGAWLIDDHDAGGQDGAGGRSRSSRGRGGAPVAEVLLGQGASLRLRDVAREDQAGAGRAVAGGVEGGDVLARDGRQAGHRAGGRRAIGGIAVDHAGSSQAGHRTRRRQGDAQAVQRLVALAVQLFLGEGRVADQIATEIEQLGASVGAGAGADFTNVYANAPANVFPQTVALMADLVRNPTFAQEELERQRDQTLDGLRVALSSPGSVAGLAAARVVYGDAAYGAPASGTVTSLPTITRDDIAAFHAARYSPSGASLVFSGDITEAQARALAQQYFGDWRAAAPTARTAPAAGAVLPTRVVVIDQPGAGQAAVYAAGRSVARADDAYFPLSVANAVLGGGYGSRLNQEIRVKRGLSYGAGSGLGLRLEQGVFTAQAQTRNDAAVEVSDLMLAEIAKLGATQPTPEELGTRQAVLTGGFGSSLETVDGLGSRVANLALYDLPLSDLATFVSSVEAVTPADVQAAAARALPADRMSLVIVGDASIFIDALRAKHPNVEVIPLTALNLDSAALK
ncbi:MAG: insulinase family protein [Brevundimonas sp.]|nr:MAG: insulinase family protein [Brevundimonas sp.]